MILKGVTLPSGQTADVVIEGNRITRIGTSLESGIDCTGLVCLPGFVDIHTHLREPGFETSETIASGSRAAALGGYTAVLAMANTLPVTDRASIAQLVQQKGEKVGLIEVHAVGAITKGLDGHELSDIEDMVTSANVRYFSDDGNCVTNTDLMLRALQIASRLGVVIAQHAQDHELTNGAQMNDGALSLELGLRGWPAAAEATIIKRDVELAIETGARLHVCHVTTAEGLDVVRWGKSKGAAITAEVTPHHLLLTEELVRTFNPVYKVNPPLRRSEDVIALRQGLIDGSIDALATDHAPHSSEKKDCEWSKAANGMIGLEVAGSVLQKILIEQGGQSWEKFAEVISTNPARIGELNNQGNLEEGCIANLTLIDPGARRTISSSTASLSTNNPWVGLELPGSVVHTIYRGEFTVKGGSLAH